MHRISDDTQHLLRGVCPVLEVPFHPNEEVDLDSFDRVVAHVIGTGVSAVMFPGFASEFHKLSAHERHDLRDVLLARTRDEPGVCTVISVPDHATRVAVAEARAAVTAGADALNLLPPHFLGPSLAAVRDHIEAVLSAVHPVPVVLQYAPAQTGTALDAGAIATIAREHSNLCLVKVESTPPGTMIKALGRQRPPLPAMVGHAGLQLPDALRRGAVGVQPGCSITELYVRFWNLWTTGDQESALDLHRRLQPYLSYWMQGIELIIAAEKLLSYQRGIISAPTCRAPGHRLDDEEITMVDRLLVEFADLLPPHS